MFKIIFTTILIVLFTGCFNNGNIDTVKNGTMSIDESLTIGQAFDNWNECENNKWDSIVEKNGRNIVVFSCTFKNIKSEINTLFQNNLIEKYNFSLLDLKNAKFEIKWAINTDKKGFKVDDIKVTYLWSDGLEKTYNVNQSFLSTIYKNEPFGGYKGSSILTFKDLANEYYKENKQVVDFELLAEFSQSNFDLMKNKNNFKESKFYLEVQNSDTIDELYSELKKTSNNLNFFDNIMNIISDSINPSNLFDTTILYSRNIDTSLVFTSFASKLLQLYQEDKTVPIDVKISSFPFSSVHNINYEPFLSKNKAKFEIIMYILSKPKLREKFEVEPTDYNRNLLFLADISKKDYITKVINKIIDTNMKLTFNELKYIDELKESFPTLFDKLNNIKNEYIKDKKKYDLSFFVYLKSENYEGLNISFIGNAENYFNVSSKLNEFDIKQEIKKWNEINSESITNNNLSQEAKQEFLNILGVKGVDSISIAYKMIKK